MSRVIQFTDGPVTICFSMWAINLCRTRCTYTRWTYTRWTYTHWTYVYTLNLYTLNLYTLNQCIHDVTVKQQHSIKGHCSQEQSLSIYAPSSVTSLRFLSSQRHSTQKQRPSRRQNESTVIWLSECSSTQVRQYPKCVIFTLTLEVSVLNWSDFNPPSVAPPH